MAALSDARPFDRALPPAGDPPLKVFLPARALAFRQTSTGRVPDRVDLMALSVRLAGTPCSPLYDSTISPDRALPAHASQYAGP